MCLDNRAEGLARICLAVVFLRHLLALHLVLEERHTLWVDLGEELVQLQTCLCDKCYKTGKSAAARRQKSGLATARE